MMRRLQKLLSKRDEMLYYISLVIRLYRSVNLQLEASLPFHLLLTDLTGYITTTMIINVCRPAHLFKTI